MTRSPAAEVVEVVGAAAEAAEAVAAAAEVAEGIVFRKVERLCGCRNRVADRYICWRKGMTALSFAESLPGPVPRITRP